MELADLVLSLLPAEGRGAHVAFVGAGGKTSGLYALAGELAAHHARVLVTTTTMIYDPRGEDGRVLDRSELVPELGPRSEAGSQAWIDGSVSEAEKAAVERIGSLASPGKILLLASAALPAEGKLRGVSPDLLCALTTAFDYLLVEADGAHRLPIKAPGPREPVLSPCVDLVVGCMGLDCLGMPIGPASVHRHELFAPLVGAAPGDRITGAHLASLACAGEGLFKSSPREARRLVALNKAELISAETRAALLDLFASNPACRADAVAACRFVAPSGRVIDVRRRSPRGGSARLY